MWDSFAFGRLSYPILSRFCRTKERGDDDRLGLPNEGGQPAPLIDALR